jgi:hypothetical protein
VRVHDTPSPSALTLISRFQGTLSHLGTQSRETALTSFLPFMLGSSHKQPAIDSRQRNTCPNRSLLRHFFDRTTADHPPPCLLFRWLHRSLSCGLREHAASVNLRFHFPSTVRILARFGVNRVRVFFCPHFPGHCFGLIPASGSFASSAFPVPRQTSWVPPIKQPLALEAAALASGCPRKMGQKKEK